MDLAKRIRKEYKAASKRAQEKLAAWSKRIEKSYNAQLELLKAGKITKEEFVMWCRTTILQSADAKQMTSAVAKEFATADKMAAREIAKAVPDVCLEAENRTLFAIDKATGVNMKLQNERAIRASMTNILLPKVDDAKAYKWNLRRLNSAITQGILNGDSIPKIAKRVGGVGVSDSKSAVRIARTAVNSAENLGRQTAYEEARDNGLELTKIWLATMDDRTRDSHVELDGEEVGLDEQFSNGLMFPCDPEGAEAEVYNCRCTMMTRVNGMEIDMSSRINKTGMSYKEWKDAHNR